MIGSLGCAGVRNLFQDLSHPCFQYRLTLEIVSRLFLTFDAIDGVESVLGFYALAVNSPSFMVSINPLASQNKHSTKSRR